MLHAPHFTGGWSSWRARPSSACAEAGPACAGLLAGAAFELLGWDILWRRDPPVRLAYERRKSFTRLADACGFRVDTWEPGIPKPFVWLTRK